MKSSSQQVLSIAIALLCLSEPAMAQRRGGFGGAMVARGGARASVTARPMGGSYNRPNINVNRPIRVDDVDVNRGYYGRDDGCCYRPVARASAVTATAAVTAAAIGSATYVLPSSCAMVVVNGVTYQRCGSTWYQPQFAGTTTTYVVVSPP
jgi:hypothetical protein